MNVDDTIDVDESSDVDEVCNSQMYDCISVDGVRDCWMKKNLWKMRRWRFR